MMDERRIRLINLGAERLAVALIDLAVHSIEAERLVERLVSEPEANLQRFRNQLAALAGQQNFRNWRESTIYARELEAILEELRYGAEDPEEGLAMLAEFYASDRTILEHCDDSNGEVGNTFRFQAMELFVEFAQGCHDENIVMQTILTLNEEDNYGLRDTLISNASRMLPEPKIRDMISLLQQSPESPGYSYPLQHKALLIESLARQIKDAPLFEKTRIQSWDRLNSAAYVDIARVYLESGDPATAFQWLQKIEKEDHFRDYERDVLLEEIFRTQGRMEDLIQLQDRRFREHPSLKTLQARLDLVGEERRSQILAEETRIIMDTPALDLEGALFLAETGSMEALETYILARHNQVSGLYYNYLIPIADALETGQRFLPSSLIYRTLLVSILQRGYAKAYPHGITYLHKLDRMAAKICDWGQFESHEQFEQGIRRDHGRKSSFWKQR